jgi:hypothetical protein
MVAHDLLDVVALGSAFALAAAVPLGRKLNLRSERRLRAVESFAGGTSLAYVVLDLMVELTEAGGAHVHGTLPIGPTEERSLFAVVLAAAAAWYIAPALAHKVAGPAIRYHSYALPQLVYRIVVGASLALEAQHGTRALLLFAVSMLLHLAVVESHFHRQFGRDHAGFVRGLLGFGPCLGAAAWAVFDVPVAALFVALALVAGGTMVQIIQTELPSPELVRIGPFLAGVGLYAAVIAARWAS